MRRLLQLEEIHAEADSTGAVVLVDGAGACPPEDSNGLPGMGQWQARGGAA